MFLATLVASSSAHVTMHYQQAGYPVSYSRVIGPSSGSTAMTPARVTLHPVPQQHSSSRTAWPSEALPTSTWSSVHHETPSAAWPAGHHDLSGTTPAPPQWKILLPQSLIGHYMSPHHVTVIHHHIIHPHHNVRHLITQAITTTQRPTVTRPPPTSVDVSTTPLVQVSESPPTVAAPREDEIAERRSVDTSGERTCSQEEQVGENQESQERETGQQQQQENWGVEGGDSDESSQSLSEERVNFPSYRDY